MADDKCLEPNFQSGQDAIKILYKAAAQILDMAGESQFESEREICRIRAEGCLDLADMISGLETIEIHFNSKGIDKVEGIPFDLGYCAIEIRESEGDGSTELA